MIIWKYNRSPEAWHLKVKRCQLYISRTTIGRTLVLRPTKLNVIHCSTVGPWFAYRAKIYPCSMTVSTVTKADHQVTGVLWLKYSLKNRTARVPTIVMKSHRSYFIVGMDFWRAFDLQIVYGNECKCLAKAKPWSEGGPAPLHTQLPILNESAIEANGRTAEYTIY